MTTIAFIGAKGSPGVTTVACAVAAVWPQDRPVVLVECDPGGGDLAARFGLTTEIGMASFVLAGRAVESRLDPTKGELDQHLQSLHGGLSVVAGPVGPDAASVVDRQLAALPDAALGTFTSDTDRDVLLDCGRLATAAPGQHRLLSLADAVIVVARGDASSVVNGRWTADRIADLRGDRASMHLVVAEPTSFDAGEISEVVGVALLATIPRDQAAAELLAGSPGPDRALTKSPLIAAARRLTTLASRQPSPKELRHAS